MNVGIVGIGTIGKKVASELDRNIIPGVGVSALCSRNLPRATDFAANLTSKPRVVPLDSLPDLCDLVIEVAGADAVDSIVKTALTADTPVMVLSCGALLEREDLFELATRHNTRIHVPSGAIIGLDGLQAASMGYVEKVTMITRKPLDGLRGSPGVTNIGVDLDTLTEALELFEGPVIEGFSLFPANVNVAAAVSMAGIGPTKTRLRVIADPQMTRNTHDVIVEGEFGIMSFHIENVPSEENPKTGRLTALSILAYLKQLTSPLHLGI